MLRNPIARMVFAILLIIVVITITFAYGNRQRQKQLSDQEKIKKEQEANQSPKPQATSPVISPSPAPQKPTGSTSNQSQPVASGGTINSTVPQTGGEQFYILPLVALVVLYQYNKKLKSELHQLLLFSK